MTVTRQGTTHRRRAAPPALSALAVAALLVTLAGAPGCVRTRVVHDTATRTIRVSGPPPAPPTPTQSPGPGTGPPTVWIGGTLTTVDAGRLSLREGSGATVSLDRLGDGATAFFRVQGSAWTALPRGAAVAPGGPACVETLLAGQTMVALRVFLGTECGPS